MGSERLALRSSAVSLRGDEVEYGSWIVSADASTMIEAFRFRSSTLVPT